MRIKERGLEIGFDLAGVAPIAAWKDLEFSRAWVERGFGGEMRYLENAKRHDPRSVLPSAQSVVCVGLIYNAPLPYSTEVSCQSSVVSGQPEDRPEKSGVRGREPRVGRLKKPGQNKVDSSDEPRPVPNFDFRVSETEDDGQRTTDDGPAGESPRAWISRYAWGRDYHKIMRAKLEKLRAAIQSLAPGAETRLYVDTGPIVERAFARLSGIGWAGKNTCLINEQKGSWFFLGVILTSLALEPDLAAPDRCGSCTRCLEACPTRALVKPYVMDASRCIAYLTIELKGSIPLEHRAAMGANVFGCDICQDVCPWNRRPSSVVSGPLAEDGGPLPSSDSKASPARAAAATTLSEFQPMEVEFKRVLPHGSPRTTDDGPRRTDYGQRTDDRVSNFEFQFSLFNPPLKALASMTEEDFRKAFRHSPLKRAKYRGWLRNLCVAMGNSRDARFISTLKELAQYPDPLVREHAAWALARLAKFRAV